jgi:hypothetical protein
VLEGAMCERVGLVEGLYRELLGGFLFGSRRGEKKWRCL